MDERMTDTDKELDMTEEATESSETDTATAPPDESEDVGLVLERELSELKEIFPELSRIRDITEIKNPLRYAALRDLGLSPSEAYLAARGPVRASDNRSHLSTSVPRATGRGVSMPREELERAREIFYGMSDSDIQRLWQRVTG